MAVSAMQWPATIVPRQAMFHPDTPSRSGGLSMTGSEQVTVSNAGRWRARIEAPIMEEESVLTLRAFLAQMQGRAGTVLVPKWELFGPRDVNGKRFNHVEATNVDLNFDLSGFGQSEYTHASLSASAALGATRISVTLLNGEGPRPGQYFGIGQRLYLCQSVWQANVGDPTTIQFWPRLRTAAELGERVILDRPVCLMRLSEDNSGELMLDLGRWGNATLDFVEAI